MINILIIGVSAENRSIAVRAAHNTQGPVEIAPIIQVDIPHTPFASAQDFRDYLEKVVRAEVIRRKDQGDQINTIVARLTSLIGNTFQIEDAAPAPPPPP
jgi:hypothetical protein